MARILLVENDYVLRFAIKLILDSASHEVAIAGNGVEALRQVAGATFDLVLTDIQMPIMDGIELIKALCSDSPEQKIIAMTAMTGITATDDLRSSQALSSGAREVIHKPFKADDFLDRIAATLGVD